MVLRRNVLPKHILESKLYRRVMSLGIADRIAKAKDNKRMEQEEDDLRLQRLGFNEKYFNNG